VRTLEELKTSETCGLIGLDERSSTMNYDQFDFSVGCVLVLGREGAGLHDLVRRTCDRPVADPHGGPGGVAERQRRRRRGALRGRRQRRNGTVHNSAASPARAKTAEGFGVHEVFVVRSHCGGGWLPAPVAQQAPSAGRCTCRASRHGDFFSLGGGRGGSGKASPCHGGGTSLQMGEREAITFLTYDLDVHLQPRSIAMAVRANVTVRKRTRVVL